MELIAKGTVHRARPDATPEYLDSEFRMTKYGELMVQTVVGTKHTAADEGGYYIANNLVPGTGLAFAITAAASDTAGNFLAIRNMESVADSPNAKRIYLDYIRLIPTVAPATATAGQVKFNIDTFLNNRYTSGGTQLAVAGVNLDSGNASSAQIFAGALVTTALSSAARQVGRAVLRTVIPVINDEYIFNFGAVDISANQSLATATAIRQNIPMPPVIIGPQQTLTMGMWFPGNATTAGSFEVEVGYWER
jgi:hypothetical protein